MDVIDPDPMMDIIKVTVMKVVMIGMIGGKEEMIDVKNAGTIEITGTVIGSREILGSIVKMETPEIATTTEKVFLEMVPGKKMEDRGEVKDEVGAGEINQRNNFPFSSSLHSVEYPLNILIPVVTKSNVKTTKQKNLSEKLS